MSQHAADQYFFVENDSTKNRTPPRNIEAERSTLGAVMLFNDRLHEIVGLLDADDFYLDKHRIIYASMIELLDSRAPIDVISIANRLNISGQLEQVGGISYLSELSDHIPAMANVRYYVELIKAASDLREFIRLGQEAIVEAYNSPESPDLLLDQVERDILAIRQSRTTPLVSARMAAQQTQDWIQDRLRGDTARIYSPWDMVNAFVRLSAGKLITVLARPSVGKTATMLQIIAHNCMRHGKRGAAFCPEMEKEEMFGRFISLIGGFSLEDAIEYAEKDKLDKCPEILSNISKWPLYIDDSGDCNLTDAIAKTRWQYRVHGLDYAVFDYVNIMKGYKSKFYKTRAAEIADITFGLKQLAKDLSIPVFLLCQLNRDVEKRKDSEPNMSDAKDGGTIEEHSDVMWFVHRYMTNTGNYGPEGEFLFKKNRQGKPGRVPFRFEGESQRFYERSI